MKYFCNFSHDYDDDDDDEVTKDVDGYVKTEEDNNYINSQRDNYLD